MSKELAGEWLKSALADLKNIEHIINDNFLTHIVAFHTQQCVEKCFKAVLELSSKKVPKEHSTLKLYGRVKNDINIVFDTDLLTDMDDLYIDARYPGNLGLLPNGKPTIADAEEFYNFAKEVFGKVKNILAES